MTLMRSLLIANRGEIALRIMRTARRLGIRTIAVYSDADRDARHVVLADEAQHIGSSAAAESYLNVANVLAAAQRSGAAAIHPGYGFLSENADFAVACRAAGRLFVGPDDNALRVMGSKSAAKTAVSAAGVPVLPGYLGERQDDPALHSEAERVGYPLLVKAIAGGGGKGMRVVRNSSLLGEALQAARREAKAAFGDDRVMLERFLERPRHIEVQVFGDRNGNVVHLHERDCSLQRRHQKIIEEAPAPGMSPALREQLHRQAVAAARAVAYEGAGTVEFLCEREHAWFIEMNTRLQVEHPVTEMVTGLDLVEWQLRIASGQPLPLSQQQIQVHGHAIELRICAEDPSRDLLPGIGVLSHFELEGMAAPWRRFDTGFISGDSVSPYYDSMLAKLIVHGPDRAAAIDRAGFALRDLRIAGVATNVAFLDVLLRSEAWRNGSFDTNLISREQDGLLRQATAAMAMPVEIRALLSVALLHAATGSPRGDSPWSRRDGYTPNLPRQSLLWLKDADQPIRVWSEDAGNWRVCWPEGTESLLTAVVVETTCMQAEINNRAWRGRLLYQPDACTWVGPAGSFTLTTLRLSQNAEGAGVSGASDGLISAPMPGQILAIHVAAGQRVERGARLVTLEAMKMEHTLAARSVALVKTVECRAGQRVQEGAVLLRLEPV